jgi:hypothetical protein
MLSTSVPTETAVGPTYSTTNGRLVEKELLPVSVAVTLPVIRY